MWQRQTRIVRELARLDIVIAKGIVLQLYMLQNL